MAKKNNTMYIIAAVVVVILIAVFMMKKPAEVQPEVPAVEEPETPAVIEEPTTTLPEAEVPTDYAGTGKMVSDVACVNGKISGRLTNTGSSTVKIGTDLKVLIRGLVVKEPGCDDSELKPGASTACGNLNGPFPVVPGKNEIFGRIGPEEVVATVTC